MSEKSFVVSTPEDFKPVIECVRELSSIISAAAAVVTLTGDLGAGKTTFTQELAKHLGVTESVVSPTFVVMKSYELPEPVATASEAAGPGGEKPVAFRRLVHIDAYRFESSDEAGPLRLEELFEDPANLICLEWPERVAKILPKEKIDVEISIADGETREVTVKS